MYKINNTLLHGLLFASLVVFPVVGFSDGSTGTSGTPGKQDSSTMNLMPRHKEGMKPDGTKPNDLKHDDMKGDGTSTGLSASGFLLGWYHYGRPNWYRPYHYYYPYRPYYYYNFYPHYNYYPYRHYYHRYYRW